MANFPGSSPSNGVTYNPTTGQIESPPGTVITGATEYTLAQFVALTIANYAGRTIRISDIPTPHSSTNGVLVECNAAGTAWRWIQTPSFTLTTVPAAANSTGWRIFVSDFGVRGSYWYSNGTRWLLESAVVISSITADIVLSTMPTSATVAKQVTIPLIDGKSVWSDGSFIDIDQLAEKTGAADIMTQYIYIGSTSRVLGDAETNTSVVAMTNGVNTSVSLGASHRIRRNSATEVKLLAGTGTLHRAASSTAKSTPITVTDMDTTVTYIDAALRVTASTTDTALTLAGHTVTLIPAGAA